MKMSRIKYCKSIAIILLAVIALRSDAQNRIVVFDFEKPLPLGEWWVDNSGVKLSQCGAGECEQLPGSEKCFRVEWHHSSMSSPYIWLTDIKVDTFGNHATQQLWDRFKDNTWLSFQVNTASADSFYLQFVVFTKDEKNKWGSREMIGIKCSEWKKIKVKLSDLVYDTWGKGNIAKPDFKSIVPARIEIGIRAPYASDRGRNDVRIDDIALSNYEP